MTSTLTGFTGDAIAPLGITTLAVTIGEEPRTKTLMVLFMVVKLLSAYNAIIGCLTLNKLRAVVSTYHHIMKEIVYPCIPDPDREDEVGQASSSLAVSTRWISTAKLLQSDLATLAQREGGE
ncbi:hypothetical protein BHE74_00033285 [Ensete ventricosum]|nr:hypothetical protein BHE74_00033285 [Ensete ventricosum]